MHLKAIRIFLFFILLAISWSFPVVAAEPPALTVLADISNQTYENRPSVVGSGEQYLPIATFGGGGTDRGFRAVAYRNNDQIVIGVRGTNLKADASLAYNAISDVSFINGTPSLPLAHSVGELSKFVAEIARTHPNAKLTITGHSLGGAIAQVVGQAAGVSVTSFNSPGPGALLGALKKELEPLQGLTIDSNAKSITNVRTDGDWVSHAGTQLGGTLTLKDPSSTKPGWRNLPSPVSAHSINTLARNLSKLCNDVEEQCRQAITPRWCPLASTTCSNNLLETQATRLDDYYKMGYKVDLKRCYTLVIGDAPDNGHIRSTCEYRIHGSPTNPHDDFVINLDSVAPFVGVRNPLHAGFTIVSDSVSPDLVDLIVPMHRIAVGDIDGAIKNSVQVLSLALGKLNGVVDAALSFVVGDLKYTPLGRLADMLLDPPAGYAYQFTQLDSSPPITQLTMPTGDVVAGWAMQFHDESGWSDITKNLEDGMFRFVTKVDKVNVIPLSAMGDPIYNPYPFMFQMQVSDDGPGVTRVVTLGSPDAAAVPEPCISLLFLTGLVLVGSFAGRRNSKTLSTYPPS